MKAGDVVAELDRVDVDEGIAALKEEEEEEEEEDDDVGDVGVGALTAGNLDPRLARGCC